MKFTCKQTDLLNSVMISLRGVPNKSSTPILSCISITASGDLVKLNSTDTEISVETSFEAKIKEEGAVCIDAKLFSDIVRKLPDGEVKFETDDTSATVKCGKAKFTLNIRDNQDFPILDDVDKSNVLKMTQESLRELINQTIFCVAQQQNNKIMTGVDFRVRDNKLIVTALDGHRIAIREWQALCDDMEFIVPAKTLTELSKILTEGDIDLFYTENNVSFMFDNTRFSSRLIEGDYFDVDKIISGVSFNTTMKVDRRSLMDSLERAILMIRENDRKPVLFDISDILNIKIETQIASLNEDVEISKDGENILLGLNPKFCLDALKAINDNTVTLFFVDKKSPCQIKGEGYCYIILPIQI